jgi:hypothetical protein
MLILLMLSPVLLIPFTVHAQQPTLRTVEQTVFTAAGKPAAHAAVCASYAWEGKAVLARGTTDADGHVTWMGLPPVRVITWGNDVPAGVMPANATTVTAPLPAPVPTLEQRIRLQFLLPNPGGRAAQATWSFDAESTGINEMLETRVTGADGNAYLAHGWFIPCGRRLSISAMTETAPLSVGMLETYYAPYTEQPQPPVTYNVTLEPYQPIVVQGRFVTPDGIPVPGVSRLLCTPVDVPNLPKGFSRAAQTRLDNHQPFPPLRELPGGRFELHAPLPGTYRLFVDLFNEEMPQLPSLLLTVKPGMPEAVVTLPAPICTAPGGSTLFWYRKGQPATPNRFLLAAHAPQMPVFGPLDALLAFWHHPTPATLAVWNTLDPQVKILQSRPAAVMLQHPDGKPFTNTGFDGPLIAPMMPVSKAATYDYVNGLYDHLIKDPDFTIQRLSGMESPPVTLWPMLTLIGRNTDYREERGMEMKTVITCPPGDGMVTLTATMPPNEEQNFNPQRTPEKPVRYQFPTANYTALAKQGAEHIEFIYEPRDVKPTIYSPSIVNTTGTPLAPKAATSVTIRWLGVGEIRNVPLPPEGDAKTPIVLPAWEPGTIVSCRVLKPDGALGANLQLTIVHGTRPKTITTDANGAFRLHGVSPGIMQIFNGRAVGSDPGWTILVPEAGLQDYPLQMTDNPRHLPYRFSSSSGINAWFLPDTGRPLPIGTRPYALPESGWVMCIDAGSSQSQMLRYTLELGIQEPSAQQPSLGLYLPLDPSIGYPSRVIITGLGNREGFSLTIPNPRWFPAPLLGMMVSQVVGLPPGEYRINLEMKKDSTLAVVRMGAGDTMAILPLTTAANTEVR